MTIEIKQLVIRATAEARPDPTTGAPEPDQRRRAALDRQAATARMPPFDQDALVATCVRQVLRELRKSRER